MFTENPGKQTENVCYIDMIVVEYHLYHHAYLRFIIRCGKLREGKDAEWTGD